MSSYKPAVFRRGLLVVLIPGVLGSCFLLILNQLWMSTAQISEEEQRRSAIVMSMSVCFNALVGYCYDIMTCSFDKVPAVESRIEMDRQSFQNSVEKLELLSVRAEGVSSQDCQRIDGFKNYAIKVVKDAEDLTSAMAKEQFTSNVARFIRYRKLMAKGFRLADAMDDVIKDELIELNRVRSELEDLGGRLKIIVVLGLPLGTLAALIALYFYTYNIVVRLKVLAQDVSNLLGLKEPEEHNNALDEFGYLDLVFCQSAQELRDAAEKREAIMQMLDHDMRSPIMATQVYIDVLQEVWDRQQLCCAWM